MRGRERSWDPTLSDVGNTPACAGKSRGEPRRLGTNRKYPRVCGEEAVGEKKLCPKMEIPPRVRGRVLVEGQWRTHHRNTPACAGKSIDDRLRGNLDGKYPRVCGEENHFVLLLNGATGNTPACAGKRTVPGAGVVSQWKYPRVCGEEIRLNLIEIFDQEIPPRVRGRGALNAGLIQYSGNTPACAGKRMANFVNNAIAWKYPRVCGEEMHASMTH